MALLKAALCLLSLVAFAAAAMIMVTHHRYHRIEDYSTLFYVDPALGGRRWKDVHEEKRRLEEQKEGKVWESSSEGEEESRRGDGRDEDEEEWWDQR